MEELSYCAYPIFCFLCSCWLLFSLALIYTLLATSISHFLTAALNFHVFLLTKFIEKDTTLLLFVLFKSPGGNAISFQIKPWVAFGLPYLACEQALLFGEAKCSLAQIGELARRLAGGREYGHETTKISRMHRLPNFLAHGAPLRARESSANNKSKL